MKKPIQHFTPPAASLAVAWNHYISNPSRHADTLSLALLPILRARTRYYVNDIGLSLSLEDDVISMILGRFIAQKYLWKIRRKIAARPSSPALQITKLISTSTRNLVRCLKVANELRMQRDYDALLLKPPVLYNVSHLIIDDIIEDISALLELNSFVRAALVEVSIFGLTQKEFGARHGREQGAVSKALAYLHEAAWLHEEPVREIVRSAKAPRLP